ncbi:MAG: hypothetical protein JNK82_36765 [Myxococcaceae bacterium]|nr:hypothetical protein [Myxococcaceae bacterium]
MKRALSVCLLLGLACCRRDDTTTPQCWDSTFDYTFPVTSSHADRLRDENSNNLTASPDVKKASCTSAWQDEVQGGFCHDRIAAFCDSACPDPAKNAECKSGTGHSPPRLACAGKVYQQFEVLVPSCSMLKLGPDGDLVPRD